MTAPALPLRFGGGRFHERPAAPRFFFDPVSLATPLAELEQVTSPVARRLAAFGLETVGDLIDHFPRRYEDFRDRKRIRDLRVGEEATVRGTVGRIVVDRTARRRVDVVRVVLGDETGHIEAVCTESLSSSSRISWLLTTNDERPPCGRYVPRTLSRMPSARTLTR